MKQFLGGIFLSSLLAGCVASADTHGTPPGDQSLRAYAWQHCSDWRYNVVGNRPHINPRQRWFRCEEQHNDRKGL